MYTAIGTTGSLARNLESPAQDRRRANDLRNRTAPFVGGVTSAVNSLFVKLDALKASAGVLVASNNEGVFSQRVGTTSESDVITVTVGSQAEDASYRLVPSQLAQTQQNVGFEFGGADETRLARGQNSYSITDGRNYFTITSDGTANSVSFEVTDFGASLNRLELIATEINVANVGVTAAVMHDDMTVTAVRLEITSTISGASGGFTITDSAGNSVAVTGTQTAGLAAQDATYALDGAVETSPTNTVSLQEGQVELELKQGLGRLVEVEVAPDGPAVASAVVNFVEDFNDLLALLANGTLAQAKKARETLGEEMLAKSAELDQIGVTQDRSGRLAVDDDRLETALEDSTDAVGELLGGEEGVVTKLIASLGGLPNTGVGRLQAGRTLTAGGDGLGLGAAFTDSGFALDIGA